MDRIRITPFFYPDDDPNPIEPDPSNPVEPDPSDPVEPEGDEKDETPVRDIYAPLTRKEIIMSGGKLTPLTREEIFLAKAFAKDDGKTKV